MRTLLQALEELVEPRVIQRGQVELCEDDPGSTCPPTVLQKSGRALVVRLASPHEGIPTNRWLFPLFQVENATPPVARSCDYIVFYAPRADEAAMFVFLCELKSGSPKGALAQLRNGKLLVDYMLAVAQHHGRVASMPAVAFRGIVLSPRFTSQKGTTKVPSRADYIEDELGLKVTYQRAGGTYSLAPFCV